MSEELDRGKVWRDHCENAFKRDTRPPFNDHNCNRCRNGELPCVKGNPFTCDWLAPRL